MRDLEYLEDIKNFSDTVAKGIEHALNKAINSYLMPDMAFQVLLNGGDDLVMVTRAQSVFDVAITLAREFRDYTKDNLNKRLSLSIAVVLAHSTFPFRTMLDIAESTLKFAKYEGAVRKLDDRSLINFLVISSSNFKDFKEYYNDILKYKNKITGIEWIRTLRPYTPDDLHNLITTARKLNNAPKNRLHALGDCIFKEHNQSKLEALGILLRWSGLDMSRQKKEQVDLILKLVNSSLAGTPEFPWSFNNSEYRTPLLDLVEVFDFVKNNT